MLNNTKLLLSCQLIGMLVIFYGSCNSFLLGATENNVDKTDDDIVGKAIALCTINVPSDKIKVETMKEAQVEIVKLNRLIVRKCLEILNANKEKPRKEQDLKLIITCVSVLGQFSAICKEDGNDELAVELILRSFDVDYENVQYVPVSSSISTKSVLYKNGTPSSRALELFGVSSMPSIIVWICKGGIGNEFIDDKADDHKIYTPYLMAMMMKRMFLSAKVCDIYLQEEIDGRTLLGKFNDTKGDNVEIEILKKFREYFRRVNSLDPNVNIKTVPKKVEIYLPK
jgi:hypothetical protein